MVNLKELKMEYNHNLNRLYNGCNYIDSHPNECDKYFNELLKIWNLANSLLDEILKYQDVTPDESLGGFKI